MDLIETLEQLKPKINNQKSNSHCSKTRSGIKNRQLQGGSSELPVNAILWGRRPSSAESKYPKKTQGLESRHLKHRTQQAILIHGHEFHNWCRQPNSNADQPKWNSVVQSGPRTMQWQWGTKIWVFVWITASSWGKFQQQNWDYR